MSGPKCGEYTVENAEERARRLRLELEQRATRLHTESRELLTGLANVVPLTSLDIGPVGVEKPPLLSGSVDRVQADVESMQIQVTQLRKVHNRLVTLDDRATAINEDVQRLHRRYSNVEIDPERVQPTSERPGCSLTELDAIADAFEQAIVLRRGEVLAAATAASRLADRPESAETPAVVDAADGLLNALSSNLSVLVRSALEARIRALATLKVGGTGDNEIAELRYLVSEANSLARQTIKRVDQLKTELDALPGEISSPYFDELEAALESGSLSPTIETRIARAVVTHSKQQDAEYVVDALSDVLSDLGYQVGERFSTAVTTDGAFIPIAGHAEHRLRLRHSSGQLLFNVVGSEDREASTSNDRSAEEAMCTSFDELTERLGELGVNMTLTAHAAPGEVCMQDLVLKDFHQVRRKPSTRRERQRGKSRER